MSLFAVALLAVLQVPALCQVAAKPPAPALTYMNANGDVGGQVKAGEVFTLVISNAQSGTAVALTSDPQQPAAAVPQDDFRQWRASSVVSKPLAPSWPTQPPQFMIDGAGSGSLPMRALMAGSVKFVAGGDDVTVNIGKASLRLAKDQKQPVSIWSMGDKVTVKLSTSAVITEALKVTGVDKVTAEGSLLVNETGESEVTVTLTSHLATSLTQGHATLTLNSMNSEPCSIAVFCFSVASLQSVLTDAPPSILVGKPKVYQAAGLKDAPDLAVSDDACLDAEVDASGTLTLSGTKATLVNGPASITVTAGGQTQTLKVKVLEYRVTVTPDSLSLLEDESKDLKSELTDQYNEAWPTSQDPPDLNTKASGTYCEISAKGQSWSVKGLQSTADGSIVIGPKDPKTTYIKQGSVKVVVVARALEMTFNAPEALIKGSSALATLSFQRLGASPMAPPAEPPVVTMTPDGAIGVERVADKPANATGITYRLTGLVTGDVVLTFTLKQAGGETLSRSFVVAVREVSGFTKVGVRLQMMDEATAEKAFGEVARRDYYIMQVAMFNRLDPSGPDHGKSILAFSDTIEMKVFLEKRSQGKLAPGGSSAHKQRQPRPRPGAPGSVDQGQANSAPVTSSSRAWELVTEQDIQDSGVPPSPEPFQTALTLRPQTVQATPEPIRIPATASVSAGGTGILSLRAGERRPLVIHFADKDGKVVPVTKIDMKLLKLNDANTPDSATEVSDDDLRRVGATLHAGSPKESVARALSIACTVTNVLGAQPVAAMYTATLPVVVEPSTGAKSYAFKYRPYLFDLMVNTFDAREYESSRAGGFRLLDFGTTLASFVGAVRPSKAENLSRINDSVTNLLVPALRRFLPDQKDTQRQNTMSMLMRPTEEIAYGTTLSRVLFFPKRSFSGYLRGYETRIAAVDTGFFEVDVAVVDKRQKQDGNKTGN